MTEGPRSLVLATAGASTLLLLTGVANALDRLATPLLNGFLREGFAALVLGAAYAGCAPHAPWHRRVLFVPAAALMSKLASASALSLGYALEGIDAPFVAGLALASAAWASAFAWGACRWLGWRAARVDVVVSSALGGLTAFALFLALQRAGVSLPLGALLSVYWASWWLLVTLAVAWSRQRAEVCSLRAQG